MRIIVFALLKPSQINYKLIPLSKSDSVNEIIVIRKLKGPVIDKVKYILLPSICRFKLFNLIITPFLLLHYTKKVKPDLILSYHFIPHGFFAWLISALTRLPFIYSQIDIDIQKLLKLPIIGKLILKILKKAIFINVPGSRSKDFFKGVGLIAEKINILHSTIDTENAFYPVNLEIEYDFIYVGVLEKRKKVHLMLQALQRLKEFNIFPRLLIIGDGSQKKILEEIVKELSLSDQVIFLGHQSNILSLINKCRFFLLTSENEGIPCALMEAMACGKVPVTVNVADVSDIVIQNETGFLIEYYDVSLISATLKSCLELSSEKYLFLSTNSRKTIIDNHSYLSATQKWNLLLKRLILENNN